MRRFEILRDGKRVGEGIEWSDGKVTVHGPDTGTPNGLRHSLDWTDEEHAFRKEGRDGFRIRYLDADQPPSEPAGKLPSEWIREWGNKVFNPPLKSIAIIRYLDERLSRGGA